MREPRQRLPGGAPHPEAIDLPGQLPTFSQDPDVAFEGGGVVALLLPQGHVDPGREARLVEYDQPAHPDRQIGGQLGAQPGQGYREELKARVGPSGMHDEVVGPIRCSRYPKPGQRLAGSPPDFLDPLKLRAEFDAVLRQQAVEHAGVRYVVAAASPDRLERAAAALVPFAVPVTIPMP